MVSSRNRNASRVSVPGIIAQPQQIKKTVAATSQEKSLGCSRCRYSPNGCSQCRKKILQTIPTLTGSTAQRAASSSSHPLSNITNINSKNTSATAISSQGTSLQRKHRRKFGCSKCRWTRNGCGKCRHPSHVKTSSKRNTAATTHNDDANGVDDGEVNSPQPSKHINRTSSPLKSYPLPHTTITAHTNSNDKKIHQCDAPNDITAKHAHPSAQQQQQEEKEIKQQNAAHSNTTLSTQAFGARLGLGCSKCRYAPKGCGKCRSLHASRATSSCDTAGTAAKNGGGGNAIDPGMRGIHKPAWHNNNEEEEVMSPTLPYEDSPYKDSPCLPERERINVDMHRIDGEINGGSIAIDAQAGQRSKLPLIAMRKCDIHQSSDNNNGDNDDGFSYLPATQLQDASPLKSNTTNNDNDAITYGGDMLLKNDMDSTKNKAIENQIRVSDDYTKKKPISEQLENATEYSTEQKARQHSTTTPPFASPAAAPPAAHIPTSPVVKLGCSRCRWSIDGCTRCRDPKFQEGLREAALALANRDGGRGDRNTSLHHHQTKRHGIPIAAGTQNNNNNNIDTLMDPHARTTTCIHTTPTASIRIHHEQHREKENADQQSRYLETSPRGSGGASGTSAAHLVAQELSLRNHNRAGCSKCRYRGCSKCRTMAPPSVKTNAHDNTIASGMNTNNTNRGNGVGGGHILMPGQIALTPLDSRPRQGSMLRPQSASAATTFLHINPRRPSIWDTQVVGNGETHTNPNTAITTSNITGQGNTNGMMTAATTALATTPIDATLSMSHRLITPLFEQQQQQQCQQQQQYENHQRSQQNHAYRSHGSGGGVGNRSGGGGMNMNINGSDDHHMHHHYQQQQQYSYQQQHDSLTSPLKTFSRKRRDSLSSQKAPPTTLLKGLSSNSGGKRMRLSDAARALVTTTTTTTTTTVGAGALPLPNIAMHATNTTTIGPTPSPPLMARINAVAMRTATTASGATASGGGSIFGTAKNTRVPPPPMTLVKRRVFSRRKSGSAGRGTGRVIAETPSPIAALNDDLNGNSTGGGRMQRSGLFSNMRSIFDDVIVGGSGSGNGIQSPLPPVATSIDKGSLQPPPTQPQQQQQQHAVSVERHQHHHHSLRAAAPLASGQQQQRSAVDNNNSDMENTEDYWDTMNLDTVAHARCTTVLQDSSTVALSPNQLALDWIFTSLSDPKSKEAQHAELRPSVQSVVDFVTSNIEATIDAGHNNSVLLVGSSGSGKTFAMERSLANVHSKYNTDEQDPLVGVVRLVGWAHSDERVAFREIARQLCNQFQLTFSRSASLGENIQFLRGMLNALTRAHKVAIFLLEDLDVFARKSKQTLLYCLLDALQTSGMKAVVLGTTCRYDCMDLMEKRVKSRFSHRTAVIVPPRTALAQKPGPDDNDAGGCTGGEGALDVLKVMLELPDAFTIKAYAAKHNAAVRAVLAEPSARSALESYIDIRPGLHDIANIARTMMSSALWQSNGVLRPGAVAAACKTLTSGLDPGIEHTIAGLSVLELMVLVAAQRASNRNDGNAINFEMMHHEFRSYSSSGDHVDNYTKNAACKAFERVAAQGLLSTANIRDIGKVAGIGGHFIPMYVQVSDDELRKGIDLHPMCPSRLRDWCLREGGPGSNAIAVGMM